MPKGWSARITKISEVDSIGFVEAEFEVLEDDVIKYPFLRVRSLPDDVKENIRRLGKELKEQNRKKKLLSVGEVIDL